MVLQADTCEALALDAAGQLVARVTSHGKELSVWALSTGSARPELVARASWLPISGTGEAVAWSPSGDLLALAGAGVTRVYTPALHEVGRVEVTYSSSVDFSPSGDLLALGAWSKGFVIPSSVVAPSEQQGSDP
jgi:WD40 repeat protein